MEQVMSRLREAEQEQADIYDENLRIAAEKKRRIFEGKVVIRGKERGWQQAKQGLLKFYLHDSLTDTTLSNFNVFVHDIRRHSGKHRHQGGKLVIFVLEGKGSTLIDDERVDWEAGDLILLPIKPNGVEHQHFNREPGNPCKWIAFSYRPFTDAMGSQFEQVENSPDYKG
jgi:uncharacterized RmlC-like cupin family protein